MKCLSICQPFAELVVSGRKTVELRSWNTRFRGEFFVHSPVKVREDDCRRLGTGADLVTGAIVGTAEIYGVRRYGSDDDLAADRDLHMAAPSVSCRYGFLLRNARRLAEPVPHRGALGFFDVGLPSRDDIISDMIDEEHRYGLVGRH